MKGKNAVGLKEVQAVYSGPEWDLWELLMGQQIHIGGLMSSQTLAAAARVGKGMQGVDLCCCTGAGMRYLTRFRDVDRMHGVDATEAVVEAGKRRCEEEGLADRIEFTIADVCQTGLPEASADFIWGEDAWCYVVDKPALINEAARLVKPGGTIAFTDWVEGPTGLTEEEADRFLSFMKFPNIQDFDGYRELLTKAGCEVTVCEDTGRFAPHVELYINMIEMQLTYDALKIIDFNAEMAGEILDTMKFMRDAASAGKIAQGRFIARKAG